MKYPLIPDFTPSFEEVSRLMKINCEIVMKQISEHIDLEIERFKKEIEELKK